jgi:hypothetical protein
MVCRQAIHDLYLYRSLSALSFNILMAVAGMYIFMATDP